jgi:fatty acid desaturase
MKRLAKSRIREAHEPHWPTVWIWFAFLALFAALLCTMAWFLAHGPLWPLVPLTLMVAHLMHAHTLAFHEAGHGILCPSRAWNEAIGLFIGTLSFQSLTAFRAVHQTHHSYLGTERDEELWPFVLPSMPRWIRRCVAAYELALGITYTPILCLRTFLRSGSPIRLVKDRRQVIYEYVLMTVSWGAILWFVSWFHFWRYLVVLYVIPGILAGNMHSIRKYSEHMGMLGSSVLGTTRSVVSTGSFGRLVSFSLFNITFHGIHHRYAKIPQARLPEFTPLLEPTSDGELPAFHTYRSAMVDMLRSLSDPRVGAQWLCPEKGSRVLLTCENKRVA